MPSERTLAETIEAFPEFHSIPETDETARDYSAVQGAMEAAEQGRLAEWAVDFLESHGHPYQPKLFLPGRRFEGPTLTDLSSLKRLCGPEKGMLSHQDSENFWQQISGLGRKIDDGIMPAPLMVGRGARNFLLCDGNHTFEALKQRGFEQYWTVSYRAWRLW